MKTTRWVNEIIIHCSATKPNMDIGVQEIDKWHKDRGWNGVGYHYVIRRNGIIEVGRMEQVIGAHVAGFNTNSIGVCWVGCINDTSWAMLELESGQHNAAITTSRDYKYGISIRLLSNTPATGLADGVTGTYIGNDGKVYRTIVIDEKWWLAENLAETKYRDGTLIPEVTDNQEWSELETGALCAYENDWGNV